MRSLRTPQSGLAVVYRPAQDKKLITSTTIQNNPNVFYVPENEEDEKTLTIKSNDISSTLIRQELKNKEDCEHLTYPSVLDYLKTISLDGQ
jgi:nicotinic acid mononucleotide adenylyltransferase